MEKNKRDKLLLGGLLTDCQLLSEKDCISYDIDLDYRCIEARYSMAELFQGRLRPCTRINLSLVHI